MIRIVLGILLLAAVAAPAVPAADKKAAKKPAPEKRLTLPADAEQIEPNTYRHTDAKGKKWIYRQTPFGLTRYEEKAEDRQDKPVADDPVRAVEEGDSIRFERPSPFGSRQWVVKKTELNEEEQKIWDRARQKSETRKQEEK